MKPIERFAEARKKIGHHLQKVAENPFFKSGYVPLPVLMDRVVPILIEHDLILVQAPVEPKFEGMVALKTVIACSKTGEVVVSCDFHIPCEKDPQKATAAITYARRTSITCLCGIAEADDDGNFASGNIASRGKRVKIQQGSKDAKNDWQDIFGD